MKGSIANGDEVEVTGMVNEEGIFKSERIHNLKTNAVIAKGGSQKGILIFLLPFVFMVIGLFIRPFEGAVIGFLSGVVVTMIVFVSLGAIHSFKNR